MLDRLPRPAVGGVRWVAAANWHVTLRFIGDADLDEVIRAARRRPSLPAATLDARPERRRAERAGTSCVPVAGADGWPAVRQGDHRPSSGDRDPHTFHGHLTLARTDRRRRLAAARHADRRPRSTSIRSRSSRATCTRRAGLHDRGGVRHEVTVHADGVVTAVVRLAPSHVAKRSTSSMPAASQWASYCVERVAAADLEAGDQQARTRRTWRPCCATTAPSVPWCTKIITLPGIATMSNVRPRSTSIEIAFDPTQVRAPWPAPRRASAGRGRPRPRRRPRRQLDRDTAGAAPGIEHASRRVPTDGVGLTVDRLAARASASHRAS